MKLYTRDYNQLTPSEIRRYEAVQVKENIVNGKLPIRKSRFRKYPKAVRHNIHLFPNNYLDIVELKKIKELKKKVAKFKLLLNSKSSSERAITSFIRKNRAYFIIGAILKEYYLFGHHEAYLFPEFRLGNSYLADYLLVGRSSGGYEFVFVEVEDSTGRTVSKKGYLGDTYRKGINQVADWRVWLDAHFSSLREVFNKAKNPKITLPAEFINYDSSRVHYAVVSGAVVGKNWTEF